MAFNKKHREGTLVAVSKEMCYNIPQVVPEPTVYTGCQYEYKLGDDTV